MKPEKITPEERRSALALLAHYSPPAASSLESHIAALEAERDEGARILDEVQAVTTPHSSPDELMASTVERLAHERGALASRVEYLERREGVIDAERDAAARRMEVAEATLSAIRQRAGDGRTVVEFALGHLDKPLAVVLAKVARYILGEDGADISPPETAEEARAELDAAGVDVPAFLDRCRETVRRARERMAAPEPAGCVPTREEQDALDNARLVAAPTTAEAFARLRLPPNGSLDGSEYDALLSLLESRMGAMARAIREVLDSKAWMPQFKALQDALTDAPPGFTLEEVRALCAEAIAAERKEWDEEGHPAKALDGVAYELRTRLERLAAMRR